MRQRKVYSYVDRTVAMSKYMGKFVEARRAVAEKEDDVRSG